MAASATFALKAGVWFRRGLLLMVSPDSRGTACPPSGRNSTYRPVQISGTGSNLPDNSLTQIVRQGLRHGEPPRIRRRRLAQIRPFGNPTAENSIQRKRKML